MSATIQKDGFPSSGATPLLAAIWRELWPRHTRKRVADAADVTERRAKDLVEQRSAATAPELLRMVQRSPEVRAKLMQLLEEIDAAEQDRERQALARRRREERRIRFAPPDQMACGTCGPDTAASLEDVLWPAVVGL